MARQSLIRIAVLLGSVAALAGCEEGQPMAFLKAPPAAQGAAPDGADGAAPTGTASGAAPVRTVERDVEAPEVFASKGPGLWDGRPSLGGVWVAHPDVTDPERVIIRNAATDKFVVGALFRRERATPGPKIQVSSDAAEALGMLAGAPTELAVVALKREEAAVAAPAGAAPVEGKDASAAPSDAIKAEAIEATALTPAPAAKDTAKAAKAGAAAPTPINDIAASAGAALAKADAAPKAAAKPAAKSEPKSAAKASTAAPNTASAKSGGSVTKPYVQLGIFSMEANASRAEATLKKAGIGAKTVKEDWQGKTFWRVLGGPAQSTAARDALLTKIKGMGFPDSYAVSK